MNKTKVDIGLDIGIASVGWAITNTNESLNIMEHGVRLFTTVDDPSDSKLKNEERREARSARRQVNRRRTLKRDFIKFLIDSKFINDIVFDLKGKFVDAFRDQYINNGKLQAKWKKEAKDLPYIFHLRQKALKQVVSKNELIAILYWYINHRGFKYETTDEKTDEKQAKEKDSKKLPIENQIHYYKTHGFLNGTFNRSFHQKEYLKEINELFVHNKVEKNIKEKFIMFFKRQRSFEEGPGNEKSKTKYGRYYNLKHIPNQKDKFAYKLEKVDKDKVPNSIWEATIGKCSFYPDKNRAPKKSFTSEVFNLLNELGNIQVKTTGEVLDKENKIDIIKVALEDGATSKKTLKKIYSIFGIDPKDESQIENLIKGVPKDKSDKRFVTEVKSLKQVRKFLPKKFADFNYLFKNDMSINEDNVIDKIIEAFSKSKVIEKREQLLKEIFKNDEVDDNLVLDLAKEKVSNVSETHALSFYAMQKMIPDFILESKMNQMIWAKRNNIDFNIAKDYGTQYLKSEWINDVIATPTVKRAFRQTTKILNAIFKLASDRKWEIRAIVIEMAREAKNKDAREQEKNRQKYFEDKNKEILSLIDKEAKQLGINPTNTTLEKIWLLNQQKGHDAYSGQKIAMEDVLRRPGDYDIDHIIPYSQSYSNNRSNRVLTRQQVNQTKGNSSSYQYFKKTSLEKYEKMKTLWRDWYCQKSEKERRVYLDYTKYDFLTSEIDYSNPANQLGFIGRNLVDTRYTTRAIMEALNEFKKSDKNDYNFKVKAINGKMTNFARNKIAIKYKQGVEIARLKRPDGLSLFDEKKIVTNGHERTIRSKSRVWHGHHAEDAYIVTILNSHFNDSKAIEKIINSPKRFSRFKDYQKEIEGSEKWIENRFEKLMHKLDQARQNLNDKMESMNFSRMVEKPKNTKLFNETLYKGKKNADGSINKYESREIVDSNFKAHYYFGKVAKNKEQLMIFRHNKKLYDELNKIYNNYYQTNDSSKETKTNPFFEIAKESENKYIDVTYQSDKTLNKKIITKRIKKLNLVTLDGSKAKDPMRIIFANNNGDSFYEGLDWVAINMYRNKKGKYNLIPINALNCTFKTLENDKVEWKINKEILKKQLDADEINDDKPVATFFRGDILIDKDGEMLYICGLQVSTDMLETKFLKRNKIKQDKERDRRTINTALKGASLIKLDVLGLRSKLKFTF